MKVVVIGSTGTGKSTLRKQTQDLSIFQKSWDVDEEILRLNNNRWPQSEEKIDESMNIINREVSNLDSIIFFTSFTTSGPIPSPGNNNNFLVLDIAII